MKNCRLYSLPIGKIGIITEVIWSKDISRRLMEIGFIKGNKVEILHASPKGNIFVVALSDYRLEMRKNLLALVMVEYE